MGKKATFKWLNILILTMVLMTQILGTVKVFAETTQNSIVSSNLNEEQIVSEGLINSNQEGLSIEERGEAETSTSKQIKSAESDEPETPAIPRDFTVSLNGTSKIVLSQSITYDLTINTDATLNNPNEGVILYLDIAPGYKLDSIPTGDSSPVKEYAYNPTTNQVKITLNSLTNAVTNIKISTTETKQNERYNEQILEAKVTGNESDTGKVATDTWETIIEGTTRYWATKGFEVIVGSGNREVTYTFDVKSAAPAKEFAVGRQELVDEFPPGVIIKSSEAAGGNWEITGSQEEGWKAVWTGGKSYFPSANFNTLSATYGSLPKLTVSYPLDRFPSGTYPPRNYVGLDVTDLNDVPYKGSPGSVQSPKLDDGETSKLSIKKAGGPNWITGGVAQLYTVTGSYMNGIDDEKIKYFEIEDSDEIKNNQGFWDHVDTWTLEFNMSSAAASNKVPYQLVYKTNLNDWRVADTGISQMAGRRYGFFVSGSKNFISGDKLDGHTELDMGEYLTGWKMILGDPEESAAAAVPSGSQAKIISYNSVSYLDKAGNSPEEGASSYENTAVISGKNKEDEPLGPEESTIKVNIEHSMMLATTVTPPTTIEVGKDAIYEVTMYNGTPFEGIAGVEMRVILPYGVTYDEKTAISVKDNPVPSNEIKTPEIDEGVSIRTETLKSTEDYPYERQIVIFTFENPIPPMRNAGEPQNRYEVGYKYNVPVKVSHLALNGYKEKNIAPVESWASTYDSSYDGRQIKGWVKYINQDKHDFDSEREIIATWSNKSVVISSGGLTLIKDVSSGDDNWKQDLETESGKSAFWGLTLYNDLPDDVEDIVIFDQLPETPFTTKITDKINAPEDALVEYSKNATSANDEAAEWTTDYTDAKAFRVTIKNILGGNSKDNKVRIEVPVTVDSNARNNQKVVNKATGTGIYQNNKVTYSSNEATITVKLGAVELTKIETGNTEKKLAGAEFELQDLNGNIIGEPSVTDADGKLSVENLPVGEYRFVETKAPAGYDLDATPIEFKIEAGQTEAVQLIKENKLLVGSVVLTKVDQKTQETLQGAVFALQDKAGKVIGNPLTIDANGKILINDLPLGEYQFVETKAPVGYDLDATPIEFKIEAGQTEAVQVTKENRMTPGSVVLTKVDKGTQEVLQGAVFELQDSKGTVIHSALTTDSHGKLAVDGLAPGDYQFIETKAPTGYDLDGGPVTFTIEKGQTKAIEVTKENILTPGSVVLTKVDKETQETLQGAIFSLQDLKGEVIYTALTTDDSGKLAVDGLAPGNYQFIETKAPTGYDLDETPVTFTIEKAQIEAVEVMKENTLTPGSVLLTKVDEKTAETLSGAIFELQDKTGKVLESGYETDSSGKISIAALAPGDYQFVETKAPTGYDLDETPVVFTIEKNQTKAIEVTKTNQLTPGSVVLTKVDGKTAETLSGAVFELQDGTGEVLDSGLTVDENGLLSVENLAPGNYQFVETKAPTGYDLDETPVTFTIKKGQTEAVQVTKTNQLTKGSVLLTKVDEKTAEQLSGAVFELQDSNGKVLQSNLTTDTSGKLAIEDLTPGDYQFIETKAPTGYDVDGTPVTFTIEKNQTESVQVIKTNNLTSGSVLLTKIDEKTAERLSGAVFALQDTEGKELKTNLVTDTNGKLSVEDLAPGDYQFIEIQAPTGYELDETPVTFTIKKGQTEAVQIKMTNEKITGSVILDKVDGRTGNKLAGAEFELKNKAGKVILEKLVTDSSGRLAIADLEPGEYLLIETKAPSGYKLDKTPVPFEIKQKKTESVSVNKVNDPKRHSVRLEKKDAKSDQLLADAEFKLLDKTGNVLKEDLKTDENGTFEINDLQPGEYQLVETKAPTGYQLDATPVAFKVTESTELITLTKYNKLKTDSAKPKEPKDPSEPNKSNKTTNGSRPTNHTYLPKTGEQRGYLLMVVGLISVMLCLVVFLKKSRSKI